MGATATVLFGKTRQAVLTVLFENPDQPRYLRELARQTGISPSAVQHEIKQLHKADLVVRREDGNRVTYQANTEHPVFPELQSIVQKTCGLPARIKTALAPHAERIRFAAIYGSIAKGRDHARSDVDLLAVGEIKLNEILSAISPIEKQIGREISVRLYKPEDFQQRRKQGDHFLQKLLTGPLTVVLGEVDDA